MEQNGLNEDQLYHLSNIEKLCQEIYYIPWTTTDPSKLHLEREQANELHRICGEIKKSVSKIKKTNTIDPVFKEYLKNVDEGGLSAMTDAYSYNISISTLFKKLIEKVIMLEQTIEELKSK